MDLVQYKHDSLIWELTREKIDKQCHHRERLHPDPQKFPLQRQPRHDDPENTSIGSKRRCNSAAEVGGLNL
jgi:hypothetical protein